MFSTQQLVLLLAASLAETGSRVENSGGVLRNFSVEDIFRDFLSSFGPTNNLLDVFVNPECLKDNTVQFKDFLKSRTEPVTLWTDGEQHLIAYDDDVRHLWKQMFSHIVYVVCRNFAYYGLWLSMKANYFRSAFVRIENARYNVLVAGALQNEPFMPPYPRASGQHVLTFANGSVFLNSEFKRNVTIHRNLTTDLWLEKPLPLSGSCMHLTCSSSYTCEHPSFGFVVELLKHRNASLCADGLSVESVPYLSSFVGNMDCRAERDTFFRQVFHQYGSAGFSFYVPKRDRVPRESIFVLPFSGDVWIGLFASSLVLVLMYVTISMVMKSKMDALAFILPMVAASLQQSVKLRSSLLVRQSSRLLYGVMALMVVVMSNVFKGRLTSLLNDLPLEGKVAEFVSFEEIVRKGNRLCILEDLGLIRPSKYYNFHPRGPIQFWSKCFYTPNPALRNSRSIRIAGDGRDTFFTYNSPTGPSEALRRELFGRGFVQTRDTVFSYPVGPEMRASSVYRRDFGHTVARAIQAGLYVRQERLAVYKSKLVTNEYNIDSAEKLVLSLIDLRPFFLAWFVGVSLSILAVVSEAFLVRVVSGMCTERWVVIVKRPFRKRLRTQIFPAPSI